MHHFIDRRPNPKGKSLGNRQRFLKRARENIKEIVDKSVRDRSVAGTSREGGEEVTIPARGIKEPRFSNSNSGGSREHILPGNKDFVVGDKIPRPKSGGGEGGKKAAEGGEGEDGFSFTLTREEYLEILFEGLELPDLVKKNTVETETIGTRRAGLTTAGTPNNLNLVRTMRNSLGRRIALQRPSQSTVDELKIELNELDNILLPTEEQRARIIELRDELALLDRRRKIVGYIDPIDLRFDTHVPEKIRNSKAVVFCLMDVSGSMQEREKDLAKRFFMLLHLFLERSYERTEIVFIRHTHHAQEVDEETFFYGRETGGTIVSTALTKMLEIIADRFPADEWNIYGAQASDGENFGSDSKKCRDIMADQLAPSCQYYAYVEIVGEDDRNLLNDASSGAELWQEFRKVDAVCPQFEMRRVAEASHIYPIFRDLFSKSKTKVNT